MLKYLRVTEVIEVAVNKSNFVSSLLKKSLRVTKLKRQVTLTAA